mgnify:CR=1 FL=1
MEKNGFIKRVTSTKDQRSKQIIITDTSKEAYNSLKFVFEILNDELIKNISKEELDAFYNTLNKLSNNIR